MHLSQILAFMGRACRCDISNEMASEIFANHIPASVMADPVKLLWRYTSTSMKSCTPRWSEIQKWGHFLADLLAASEGRRLRQKEWCRQLGERLKLSGVLLKSVDEVSLMAYRPLSHMVSTSSRWLCKSVHLSHGLLVQESLDHLHSPFFRSRVQWSWQRCGGAFSSWTRWCWRSF